VKLWSRRLAGRIALSGSCLLSPQQYFTRRVVQGLAARSPAAIFLQLFPADRNGRSFSPVLDRSRKIEGQHTGVPIRPLLAKIAHISLPLLTDFPHLIALKWIFGFRACIAAKHSRATARYPAGLANHFQLIALKFGWGRLIVNQGLSSVRTAAGRSREQLFPVPP